MLVATMHTAIKGEKVHCLNRGLASAVDSGADTCEKSVQKSGHACTVKLCRSL